jgi:phage terminase Nu1 subunit (DNA packaging protein)
VEAAEIGQTAPKKRLARVNSPEDTVSREFLADVLGVVVASINNFVKEGMPKEARGRFVLKASVQWYLERERTSARGNKGLNDLDLARQRKTVAEARIAELDLAEKEGDILPASVYEDELRKRCESIAGAVKAIGRYQPDVKAATSDEAADALLERMGDEILAELHGLKDEIE